jgi:hypothetical protein
MPSAGSRGFGPSAVVTGLVAGLILVTGTGCAKSAAGPSSPSSLSTAAMGVGHKWRLTLVSLGSETVAVPASLAATIQLTSDGQFLADDTVNALSGTWVSTPTGYRVTRSGSTLVGYAGGDATKVTVIDAIDSVAGSEADVAAHAAGTMLTLTVPKYALTFSDDGLAATNPPPSPTTTGSH